MDNNTEKTKNIIIGVVVIVIIVGAYIFLADKDKEGTDSLLSSSSSAQESGSVSPGVRNLVATLNRVKFLDIGADFFASEIFHSLEDTRLQILPEPQGRENPFLPI